MHGVFRYLFRVIPRLSRYEDVAAEQGVEGSCIRPPALDYSIGHFVSLDVRIVHVRDFKLTAAGRFKSFDDIEYRGVIHVQTRNRIFRLWLFRLLLDLHDPITVNDGNSESLRVFHSFQVNLSAVASTDEVARRFANAVLVQIVASTNA